MSTHKNKEYTKIIKKLLIKARDAPDIITKHEHIQAVITMIDFHYIEFTSRKMVEIIPDLKNGFCIINGCKLDVTSLEYETSVNNIETLNLELVSI